MRQCFGLAWRMRSGRTRRGLTCNVATLNRQLSFRSEFEARLPATYQFEIDIGQQFSVELLAAGTHAGSEIQRLRVRFAGK